MRFQFKKFDLPRIKSYATSSLYEYVDEQIGLAKTSTMRPILNEFQMNSQLDSLIKQTTELCGSIRRELTDD